LQYLYLLFDDANPINHDASNAVFTTEGHYLALDKKYLKAPPKSRKGEAQICPRFDPVSSARYTSNSSKATHELQPGVQYRKDMEYARGLVGVVLDDTEALRTGIWSPSGFCESPNVEVRSDFECYAQAGL
jgi:mannosidase alpha-like ER degradation enhancer 1